MNGWPTSTVSVTSDDTRTSGVGAGGGGGPGTSTGPHLHFQLEPGHWGEDTENSLTWLNERSAEGISDYLPAVKTCA